MDLIRVPLCSWSLPCWHWRAVPILRDVLHVICVAEEAIANKNPLLYCVPRVHRVQEGPNHAAKGVCMLILRHPQPLGPVAALQQGNTYALGMRNDSPPRGTGLSDAYLSRTKTGLWFCYRGAALMLLLRKPGQGAAQVAQLGAAPPARRWQVCWRA